MDSIDTNRNPYAAPRARAAVEEPIGPRRFAKRGAIFGAIGFGSLIPLTIAVLAVVVWIGLRDDPNRGDIMARRLTLPTFIYLDECGLTVFGAIIGAFFGAAIGWDRRRKLRKGVADEQTLKD